MTATSRTSHTPKLRRRPGSLARALATTFGLVVASGGAVAAPRSSWSLTVTRTPRALGCADEGALSERLRAIAPPEGASSSGALRLSVAFTRDEDGRYVAQLVVEGKRHGERLLEDRGPTCDALSEAVAVTSSLLLDEDRQQPETAEPAAERSSEARAGASSAGTPSTERADEGAARDAAARNATSRVVTRVSVEGGPSYGLGAAFSALGTARAGVRASGLVLDVGFGGVLPRTTEFGGGEVRTSLWFGTARGCYLLGGERLGVGPCAAVAVGRLHGVGDGYAQGANADLTFVALAGGLLAEASLGSRLFATAGASLWVATQKRTFSVQGAGIAWESSPVGGSLVLGLGARVF